MNRKLIDQWKKDRDEVIELLDVDRFKAFYRLYQDNAYGGKPMIVTTNLTAEQLKKPEDVASGRIYDRILERCHPLKIDGESMRRKKLREDFGEIEAMLKGEKQ